MQSRRKGGGGGGEGEEAEGGERGRVWGRKKKEVAEGEDDLNASGSN